MTDLRTLVLQSHRWPLPAAWLECCLDSVRGWAAGRGYAYRFEDDVLFERLDPNLRERTRERPAVAADLGRLAASQAALEEGFDAVVWLDADTLIVDPVRLELPRESYALGREVWVQPEPDRGRRTYVKVHNAFLMFRPGNPFLDFYRHAAERLVLLHEGPMVPQLVGPKLLAAVHNLIRCPVVEEAAVLCPTVAGDLLAGGGPFLEAFRAHTVTTPAALNLCASVAARELGPARILEVIDRLRTNPAALQPRPV